MLHSQFDSSSRQKNLSMLYNDSARLRPIDYINRKITLYYNYYYYYCYYYNT